MTGYAEDDTFRLHLEEVEIAAHTQLRLRVVGELIISVESLRDLSQKNMLEKIRLRED